MKIRRCVAREPVDDETPRPGATPGQTEPQAEQAPNGNATCQSAFGRALLNSCSPANLRPLVERVTMLGSKLHFGSALDVDLKEAAAEAVSDTEQRSTVTSDAVRMLGSVAAEGVTDSAEQRSKAQQSTAGQ